MESDKKRKKLSPEEIERIREEERIRIEARMEFERERKREILESRYRIAQEPFSNAIIAIERILDYDTIDSLETEYLELYDLVTNKDVLVGFFRDTLRESRSYFVERSLLRIDPEFALWEKGESDSFPQKFQVLDNIVINKIDKIIDRGIDLIDIVKGEYHLLENLSKDPESMDYRLAQSYCIAFRFASDSLKEVVGDEFRRSISPTLDSKPYWDKYLQFERGWVSYFKDTFPDLLSEIDRKRFSGLEPKGDVSYA